MLFTPKSYKTTRDIMSDFVHQSAHSDTTINGRDVFGYVDGVAFEAVTEYDESFDQYYWACGNPIKE